MLATASLTRVMAMSLGLVVITAVTGLTIVALGSHVQQIQLRDAQLRARAAQAIGALQFLGDAPRQSDWAEAAPRLMRAAGIDFGSGSVEVMIPALDAPSKWRLVAALPERPEAILPISDPNVQRALAGSHEPVLWYDPSGIQWCSVVVPLLDRNGRQVALIEARANAKVVVGAEVWWATGLLAVGASIGLMGLILAIRRTEAAVANLSQRVHEVSRGEQGSFAGGALHPRELGPLAGSLQQASAESTTRRVQQHRELTELRVQVARFQGADRAKTTLLVALCRSLRQSVDSLRASSALLAQTRIDRTQRDYVETLQSGCGDLLTRIGDVLDFALLEAECLSLEQRPLRPRLVLEEALLIVAERCVQLPIELAWYAEPTVPERVIGDVARVRQVLVNLISLAASTAEEGTVAVHVIAEADQRLTFRISLMGVTLTAERIRLLLEGAISSDSSSDRLQGEGLGLVLGKRLAQAMGGSLRIERGEGDDIELVCTLRVMSDDISPEQPLLHRDVVVAHERPATRRMLTSILERAGATVVAVGDHRDLLAALMKGPRPSAVILGSRVAPEQEAGCDAPEVIAGVQSLAASWPVVLVVDPVHRGFTPELRSAGALGLVAMPVRQQALLTTVSDAVSGIKRDSSQHQTLSQSFAQQPARVLVVEDNEVNRLVLVRMLESLGIQPDLAENGKQAVDSVRAARLAGEPYALILMDCMMPVMDGLAATNEIRISEESEPGVWIIAVTANAMANDRTKCLAVGMNDYLAKPVTPLALHEAITRWRQAAGLPRKSSQRLMIELATRAVHPALLDSAQPTSGMRTAENRANAANPDEVVEVDFSGLKMLAKLAGPGALSEVVSCFLGESEKMLNDVHAASMAGDVVRLRAAAHKMKGSSGTVGLLATQAHVARIESAAKDGDLAAARAGVETLPSVFAAGMAQLRAFRDGV